MFLNDNQMPRLGPRWGEKKMVEHAAAGRAGRSGPMQAGAPGRPATACRRARPCGARDIIDSRGCFAPASIRISNAAVYHLLGLISPQSYDGKDYFTSLETRQVESWNFRILSRSPAPSGPRRPLFSSPKSRILTTGDYPDHELITSCDYPDLELITSYPDHELSRLFSFLRDETSGSRPCRNGYWRQ
jgi:hypothetical protein